MTRVTRCISRWAILCFGLAVLCVAFPSEAYAQNPERTPLGVAQDSVGQLRELENYTFTMDDMRKFFQVGRNLERVGREHPELQADARIDIQHLDKSEAKINANPLLLKAVMDTGLTTRQYTLMNLILFLTSIASLNSDAADAVKAMRDAHLNPANLAFIKEHEQELSAMGGAAPAPRQGPGGVSVNARAAAGPVSRQQPGALPPLSPQAQLALDELSSRYATDLELIQGWFRDRTVLYYNFGSVPLGTTAGRVLWPIHGFDARGNPVAIRGQRPIFSTIPGLAGYSGVFRLAYVVTADHVQPNQLRDIASVEALVRRNRASMRETDIAFNLPIVPRGTRLARDTSQGMLGWYQGRDVQFFDFGAVSLVPAPMWRFTRGQDASGEPAILTEQNSIVDSVPVAPTYPDLWEIRLVRVDSAYVPNSLKSAAALRSAGLVIDPPSLVRNLPITIMDGARIERLPSPVRAFADLRSPFPPALTRPQ